MSLSFDLRSGMNPSFEESSSTENVLTYLFIPRPKSFFFPPSAVDFPQESFREATATLPPREKAETEMRKVAERKADFGRKEATPLGRRGDSPLPTLFTTFFPQEFLATHCAGICEKSKLTVTIRLDSWSEIVESCVCVRTSLRFHGGLEMVLIAVYVGEEKKKKGHGEFITEGS